MKCEQCGKEMIKVGELSEKETHDWIFIKTKDDTASQALDSNTINGMQFKEGELFEYFKACFEAKAEAEFLRYVFFRDLRARFNISKTENIWLEEGNTAIEVYVHPQD